MPKASEATVKLAKEVLAKIAGYDPWFPKPNDAMLLSWADHFDLKNPAREDVLEAVTRFYGEKRESNKPPLPADITALARAARQDRLLRNEYVPPPDKSDDPQPPEPEGVEKISLAEWEHRHDAKFPHVGVGKSVEEVESPRLPPHIGGWDSEVNPLTVKCQHCGAPATYPCVIPETQEILTRSRAHPRRIEAARAAAQIDA